MISTNKNRFFLCLLILLIGGVFTVSAQEAKRILVIGDSMTGWMGERLSAYGQANHFDVGTIVWDGSTIKKWGNSAARAKQHIDSYNPDAVIICLGLNECAERNPEANLGKSFDALMQAIGDRPVLWVGPPSWPGKPWGEPLNSWLSKKVGKENFFYSHDLKLARQSSTNPHPTREGINKWTDAIVEWIPANASFSLPGYNRPANSFSRGKTFIYKKMKDSL